MKYKADLADMQAFARAKMISPPDFVIGDAENPYLRRWWIVPPNPFSNTYLHEILRPDDDRALHDHPWDNTSVLLLGGYREITPYGVFDRKEGDVLHRQATDSHRLEVDVPCVSLFFTGPKLREWGFHCAQGWRHWQDFTGGENGSLVGRGCD